MTLQDELSRKRDGADVSERPAFAGDFDDGPLGKQWVRRSDAVALSPCSMDTLNRRIVAYRLRLRTGPGNAKFVFLPDLAQIGLVPLEVAEPSTGAESAAELIKLRAEVVELSIKLGVAEEKVRIQEDLMERLGAEVEKKDKLLDRLVRANENLSRRGVGVDLR